MSKYKQTDFLSTVPVVYQNRQAHAPEPKGRDNCQSPPYAVKPIVQFLNKDWVIWECAAGEGYMSASLVSYGFVHTVATTYPQRDFLAWSPDYFDCIVTNPPFSQADKFLHRCFSLKRPFALLMKSEIIANKSIQKLCARYGDLEHVFPETRINYKMPNKGWDSKGAPFNTHWFTFGLNMGRPFTYLQPILTEKKEWQEKIKQGGIP